MKQVFNLIALIVFLRSFFPGRPIISEAKKITLGSLPVERSSKYYQAPSRLESGIVLFWCAIHRKCLGWVFLQSAESIEIVYSTVLSRFSIMPNSYAMICM